LRESKREQINETRDGQTEFHLSSRLNRSTGLPATLQRPVESIPRGGFQSLSF
jgi:hypothetical protein